MLPSHRYDEIASAIAEKAACPAGASEADLFNLLTGEVHSNEVDRAHNIFIREYKREVLEAMLLSTATADEIYEVLKVPVEITKLYMYLFFDVDTFADELERIDYAYEYTQSAFGKDLKRAAIDLGKECLKVRLSRGNYVVTPTIVQSNIRSTAFMMANLVRVNQVDSALANAALRWAQIGLKSVEDDSGTKGAGNLEGLILALETREETTDSEESGIPAENVIH